MLYIITSLILINFTRYNNQMFIVVGTAYKGHFIYKICILDRISGF